MHDDVEALIKKHGVTKLLRALISHLSQYDEPYVRRLANDLKEAFVRYENRYR